MTKEKVLRRAKIAQVISFILVWSCLSACVVFFVANKLGLAFLLAIIGVALYHFNADVTEIIQNNNQGDNQ